MHPWHDYPIDEATIADHVPAIIEVPMGSKNKYELVHPLTIVDVRAIGVMQMRDEKSIDDKLLTVCIGDPAFADYLDFRELPKHVVREMQRFVQDYKTLEGKEVEVMASLGPDHALRILRDALAAYRAR
jgi:inorganic pyrophosphatase